MKLCRYNWHSAGSLGWPFPVLRYKCINQIKYTEALLSSSTRNLLRFEISKMLIAVLENILVTSFTMIFGTLSRGQGDTWYQYGVVSSGNGCAAPSNPGVYADVVYFLPWIQQHTGSQYTRMNIHTVGWQWHNFVPYLCQLVLAAILWVKLLEMLVTLLSFKYALSVD